ncbi:hypothetical protein RhiirC2_717304 [Rhizophagus irregularis]|uniref:Tyr recombinase domain-containing protein n=1 Tax=Rhizophagus irregularis TaxID=588596 RepID=A0A2N1MMX0_9GLOM|nr:hypothetical protein RhiirC2_717304 [Rhizophagus irregularis]
MAEDFKKREDGGFDILIYRSKTNQRVEIGNRGKADKLILPNNPDIIGVYEKYLSYHPQVAEPNFYLQECDEPDGCWYKRIHVGQNRLKSFMNEICKICGIDCTNRKITNHTGRKTLVQGLQKLGFSRDSMKLATRHKNVESLDSYELPREQEQIGMINNLVDNIQCTKRKQGLCGGEHFYLMDEDFKKREDGGFDILIYQSKTNQRVEIGNRGKAADKFILPNNPDIIGVYENICPTALKWLSQIFIFKNVTNQMESDAHTFDIDNNYKMKKNKGFVTAKEDFTSNCEISNTNNLKDLHKPLQEINPNNTNLEITMNTNNLVNLINSGVLQRVNLKINISDK